MGRILMNRQLMTSIVVWNLPYYTTAKELKRAFEKFGEVGDVYIPMDKRTGESRGFAFVRYMDERDAMDAKNEMHGSKLNGREVRINMAHKWQAPRHDPRAQEGSSQNGGYRSRARSRSSSRSRSRSTSRSRIKSKRVHFSPSRYSSSSSECICSSNDSPACT